MDILDLILCIISAKVNQFGQPVTPVDLAARTRSEKSSYALIAAGTLQAQLWLLVELMKRKNPPRL